MVTSKINSTKWTMDYYLLQTIDLYVSKFPRKFCHMRKHKNSSDLNGIRLLQKKRQPLFL